MKRTIPKDFILGAAASAWQTEGWSGKKAGQDSYLDAWYQVYRRCGLDEGNRLDSLSHFD